MSFCAHCGNQLQPETKFCPKCGTVVAFAQQPTPPAAPANDAFTMPDSTADFDPADIASHKLLAILSYLGVLYFWIPLFGVKNSPFVQYHAKQGTNLLIISAANSLFFSFLQLLCSWNAILSIFMTIIAIIANCALAAAAVVAIVFVCQGKAKALPLLHKIRIIK